MWIEDLLIFISDKITGIITRPIPPKDTLEKIKIIAHRGSYDNVNVFENSLAALDPLIEHNIWGAELDLRWSKDGIPVIFHDSDFKRLFSDERKISEMNYASIRQSFPCVPSLKEVVQYAKGRVHLVIELKDYNVNAAKKRSEILRDVMSPLVPIRDYHFISFYHENFLSLDFLPEQACLPIVYYKTRHLKEMVEKNNYGGLCGHYIIITTGLVNDFRRKNLTIGTGQIASKQCMYREINRGVNWIFTDDALFLQETLNSLRGLSHKT